MNATIKERVAIAQWMIDSVLKFDYFQTSASSPLFDEVELNTHLQYLKDHGTCITICPQLTPKLYALCMEVQQTLGYEPAIDYLLESNSCLNGYSYYSLDYHDASVVCLSSGAVEHLAQDELRSLIGHEIGHIINRDSDLNNLYATYREKKKGKTSDEQQHKMHLYQFLSELEADRYSLLSCGNEETVMRQLCKFMAGITVENFALPYFLKVNHDWAQQYMQEQNSIGKTHPVYPLRVEALHIFATAHSDWDLNNKMQPIITALENYAKHA